MLCRAGESKESADRAVPTVGVGQMNRGQEEKKGLMEGQEESVRQAGEKGENGTTTVKEGEEEDS